MNIVENNANSSPVVFLCSPYEDLSDEREAILYVLEKLELRHHSMEFFGARDKQPIETCLDEVRQSNLIIVLLGHLYGSLVPGTNLSFSHMEYNEAYKLKIPSLVYFKDESIPVLPKLIEHDPQKLSAFNAFKNLLKERHTPAYFKSPLELAVSVSIDIQRRITIMGETQPKVPSYKPLPIPTIKGGRKVWKLKMHHEQPATSLYQTNGHALWAQDIEIVTEGAIKINIYPFQTMLRPMDAWEGVKSRIVDIAWIYSGFIPHQPDLLDAITLPFIIKNGEQGSYLAWNLFQKFHEIQEQISDVKVLSICTTEPFSWFTTKRQIKTIEDIRGLKLRTMGKSSTDIIKFLGGAPVAVPIAETYVALEKGIIDGLLSPGLPVADFNLYQNCKYFTYMPTTCSYFILVMNKDVWNEMTPEIQQEIMSVSGERQAERYGARVFDYGLKELLRTARDSGSELIEYTIPQNEINRWSSMICKPIYERWVNDMEIKGNKVASQILSYLLEETAYQQSDSI